MLSTDNALSLEIKAKEREVEMLYKRMPFFKRLLRRITKRDSFVAGQLVYEPYGMIKGFVAGVLAAGGSVVKILAAFGAIAWEHITTFFEGVVVAVVASN
jgi:hypothetical protein